MQPPGLIEHELRYLVDEATAGRFLARAAGHVQEELWDATSPVAYTLTTYLDTADLDYFHTSRGAVRQRVRIREYAAAPPGGAPRLTGLCALEYKRSDGTSRHKERFAAVPEVISGLVTGAYEPADCPASLRARLVGGRLRPVVTSWYRRSSYADPGRHVRITLDRELAWALPRVPGPAGADARPQRLVGRVAANVLEVKHHGHAPGWLHAALDLLPPADGTFSKFRVGVLAVAQAERLPEGQLLLAGSF